MPIPLLRAGLGAESPRAFAEATRKGEEERRSSTFEAGDEILHFGVIQEKLQTEGQAMALEPQLEDLLKAGRAGQA